MPDDKTICAPLDRKLINTSEAYEMNWWAQQLGVTKDRIRAAVALVGPSVERVRAHLGIR